MHVHIITERKSLTFTETLTFTENPDMEHRHKMTQTKNCEICQL